MCEGYRTQCYPFLMAVLVPMCMLIPAAGLAQNDYWQESAKEVFQSRHQ